MFFAFCPACFIAWRPRLLLCSAHLVDLHDDRNGVRCARIHVIRQPARVGVHPHTVARRLHQLNLKSAHRSGVEVSVEHTTR